MHRTTVSALLVCVALLAVGVASATAAPPPKFKIDLFASSTDRANFEERGFPDRCKTWTQASSALDYEIEAKSPFNMALVRNPVTDSVYGLIPREPVWVADTARMWRTRPHVARQHLRLPALRPVQRASASAPARCPTSSPPTPAAAPGRSAAARLALTVVGGALSVTGGPGADLSSCIDVRDRVVPMFLGDLRFAPLRIPGAVRKLLRLRVGERARIERTERRGDCGEIERTRAESLRLAVRPDPRDALRVSDG